MCETVSVVKTPGPSPIQWSKKRKEIYADCHSLTSCFCFPAFRGHFTDCPSTLRGTHTDCTWTVLCTVIKQVTSTDSRRTFCRLLKKNPRIVLELLAGYPRMPHALYADCPKTSRTIHGLSTDCSRIVGGLYTVCLRTIHGSPKRLYTDNPPIARGISADRPWTVRQ